MGMTMDQQPTVVCVQCGHGGRWCDVHDLGGLGLFVVFAAHAKQTGLLESIREVSR
jgi:hypothetical protein